MRIYLVLFSVLTFQLLNAQSFSIVPSLTTRSSVLELSNYNIRSGNNYYLLWVADATKQLKNAYCIGIEYNCFKKKRMYLVLENYFRQTPMLFHVIPNGTFTPKLVEESRFKRDHILNFVYEFGLKKIKQAKFLIGAGLGTMNCNTKFDYQYDTGNKDLNGNAIIANGSENFKFNTIDFLLGIRYKKWKANITIFGTPDEDFKSKPSIVIESKIGYIFSFRGKKRT